MNEFSRMDKPEDIIIPKTSKFGNTGISILLFFGILSVAGYVSLLDLLPPIARDALIHHLAIPKIWLETGGFKETPWASFSYYPMNIQLLYLIPLSLNADWASGFIHHSFGLLTGVMVFLYLRRNLNAAWALLGVLLFVSTPAVIRAASSAYVDLGLAFFFTGATFGLAYWKENRRLRWFLLSAIAMGLAMGTKYQGMIGLPALLALVVWYSYKSNVGPRRAIMWSGLYCLVAFAVFSPWLIKNQILTGNPLYPLFNSLFGIESVRLSQGGMGIIERRILAYGETPLEAILVPFRFFLAGKDYSPAGFDGVLNPIFLFIPPLALFRPRHREIRPIGFVCAYWILTLFLIGAHSNRYLIPVLPLTAVLAVFGLKEIHDFLSRRSSLGTGQMVATIIIVLTLAWNLNWMGWFWNHLDPLPYLKKVESREAFLFRHLPYYPVVKCLNERTDTEARVAAIFMGNQGYYYDRDYIYQSGLSGKFLDPMILKARTPEDIWTSLVEMGITHLMIREDLFIKYLNDNYSTDQIRLLAKFQSLHLAQICNHGTYTLYHLVEGGGIGYGEDFSKKLK